MGQNLQLKKNFDRYWFILPAGFIYIIVIVIPGFYSFYLSLFKWNGISPTKKFVGFKNYIYLFLYDKVFVRAAINNVIWVLLTLTLTVTVAFIFALLLNRKFRGRSIFRGLFYFPYVLSYVVVAIIWDWIYHPQLGLLYGLFSAVGIGDVYNTPLGSVHLCFFAVFIAALWQGFGAPMILFLAGLNAIPKQLYEAASIDGANKIHSLFNITLPMLRETFVVIFAIQIIASIKVYDIVVALTSGGPANRTQTMATWMVNQTFEYAKIGTGTAISVLMVLVLMVVVIPFVLFMAKD
jgi:raffinose/stachyose/melibiose transport system permease protein